MKTFLTTILCLAFTFSCFGQITNSDHTPTPDEQQLVKSGTEISDVFTKRMIETGDVSTLLGDLFVSDFIERYIKEQKKKAAERDLNPESVFFVSGIEYNADLLDKATTEDWKRLYVSTLNFIHFGSVTSINRLAGYISQGKEPDDSVLDNIYPPNVVRLLDSDPILKNFIQMKGKSNPIKTVEEMRRVNGVLEQVSKLLNEGKNGKPSVKLSKDTQKLLPQMIKRAFRYSQGYNDSETFGYPKGTPFLSIRTTLVMNLIIVKDSGKYKIVWATPDLDD